MNEEEFADLAAGYALNALSSADRAAFEAERLRHPEWEHWISAYSTTAAVLADGVEDAQPPAAVRSRLLARIGTEPQVPASGPPGPTDAPQSAPGAGVGETAPRRRWTRGLFALAASLVLLVVIGFGAASIIQLANRPPAVVALDEIEAAPDAASATVEVTGGGTATAHWAPSVGEVVLVADGLPRISADDVFELWWVRGDGAVSAGTFEAGADGASTVLLDGEWQADDVIAVTVEPDGGAPDGVPTTEPIVAIPTA